MAWRNNMESKEADKTLVGNEKDKEELRGHLLDYLRDTGRVMDRGYIKCLNPSHDDKHPSMSYDAKRKILHCFACGATYDIFSLYEQDTKKGFLEAFSDLSAKYLGKAIKCAYGLPRAVKSDFGAQLSTLGNGEAISYLKDKRGFLHAKEVATFARVKSSRDGIYFPHYHYADGEYKATDYQARAFQEGGKGSRYRRSKGTATSVYDPLGAFDYATERNIVAITEGEIDALTIFDIKQDESAKEPLRWLRPIAMSGCKNTAQLLEALKGIADISKYGFILCLDGDQAGKDATIEVARLLDGMGASYTTRLIYPEGAKDFNEWAIKDRDTLRETLIDLVSNFDKYASKEEDESEKALDKYQADFGAGGVASSLLGDILSPVDPTPIKTGFSNLDKALGGEINAGVMTIGGLSSLGKTSLILQIADQIALEGKRDAIYFSLEMSAKELVAKSISRLTYLLNGKDLAKTTAGIMQKSRWKRYGADDRNAIYNAFTAYKAISQRLYFIEPSKAYSAQDIADAVREHIKTTKRKPVVFVDYLQILSPITQRATDKQAVDENMTALKRLSAQEGLLIVLVSSLSRSNYNSAIDMASFKDSGSIEYSSDYLLGLDLQDFYRKPFTDLDPAKSSTQIRGIVKSAKEKTPREIAVSVIKNRNGETGGLASFSFYPMFNCFIERDSEMTEQTKGAKTLAEQAETMGRSKEEESLPF